MANLLGDVWGNGSPHFERALQSPATYLHLYGKSGPRPGRKMGHLTKLSSTAANAASEVIALREAIRSMEGKVVLMIDELNQRFSVPGLSFLEHQNGLVSANIQTAACTGELFFQGAHVTSWCPTGSKPVLWMSQKSNFEQGQAYSWRRSNLLSLVRSKRSGRDPSCARLRPLAGMAAHWSASKRG